MIRILQGDCRDILATLPEQSIQCCVTSPPYFGLRDYGVDGQIGLEKTPDEYVAEMVAVFRDVRRVLRDDGVLWLNLGDSYASTTKGTGGASKKQISNSGAFFAPRKFNAGSAKEKDLIGIPWMVAFALRADGWYLRSEVIWAKPNPMPESVTDRPTKAHEQVFLLSKSARYFYDAEAIREDAAPWNSSVGFNVEGQSKRNKEGRIGRRDDVEQTGRNARTIWTIATQPFSGAHFATMPPDLAERCILAGSVKGHTVLDPFGGAGTTALVADRLQRDAIICELNPEFAAMAKDRIEGDGGMLVRVVTQ